TLVVGRSSVSRLWSPGATVAVAPARSAGSILVKDAPRVLPRLGHLARELASPPARLARRTSAGGAPPLSLARLPLAASPAAARRPIRPHASLRSRSEEHT